MNSNSNVLKAIQAFYPDYHPLISIAHIAHDTSSDPRLKYDCHKTIAKYVEPELKSLEVRGTIEDARRVSVSLFDDAEVIEAEIVKPKALSHVDSIVDGY